MGKGSRPQRILWRSIWANYFPTLIPFHFLCEGNNFTLLPTSLSTNMCDRRILVFLLKKNKTALSMILFQIGYTDWVTITYLRQKKKKKSCKGDLLVVSLSIPLLCWWRTRANYICIVERNWWLLVTNEQGRKLFSSLFFLLLLVGPGWY